MVRLSDRRSLHEEDPKATLFNFSFGSKKSNIVTVPHFSELFFSDYSDIRIKLTRYFLALTDKKSKTKIVQLPTSRAAKDRANKTVSALFNQTEDDEPSVGNLRKKAHSTRKKPKRARVYLSSDSVFENVVDSYQSDSHSDSHSESDRTLLTSKPIKHNDRGSRSEILHKRVRSKSRKVCSPEIIDLDVGHSLKESLPAKKRPSGPIKKLKVRKPEKVQTTPVNTNQTSAQVTSPSDQDEVVMLQSNTVDPPSPVAIINHGTGNPDVRFIKGKRKLDFVEKRRSWDEDTMILENHPKTKRNGITENAHERKDSNSEVGAGDNLAIKSIRGNCPPAAASEEVDDASEDDNVFQRNKKKESKVVKEKSEHPRGKPRLKAVEIVNARSVSRIVSDKEDSGDQNLIESTVDEAGNGFSSDHDQDFDAHEISEYMSVDVDFDFGRYIELQNSGNHETIDLPISCLNNHVSFMEPEIPVFKSGFKGVEGAAFSIENNIATGYLKIAPRTIKPLEITNDGHFVSHN